MKIKIPFVKVGVANFDEGTTEVQCLYCWQNKLSKKDIADYLGQKSFQVLQKGSIIVDVKPTDFTADFNKYILECIEGEN